LCIFLQVPELKIVGQKATPLIGLAKPFQYGLQYSKNAHYDYLVKYLELAISQKFSWTNTKESLFPSRVSTGYRFFGSAFEMAGPTFTVYTKGMDKWLDQLLYFTGKMNPASTLVREQLSKITSMLNIEERKTKEEAEVFLQAGFMEFENDMYLNEAKVYS